MRHRGFVLGLAVASSLSTVGGCIEDADCGVCDPENLVLQSISGVNYAGRGIHVVSPACEGPRCPAPFTKAEIFVEQLGPCEQSEEALESASAEEFCKLSPLVTDGGLQFVFNNLLDPTSIELVRKRPDNPQLFEVYDWKSDVLHVQGPITRFNGDYTKGDGRTEPDDVSRIVNLSCIDNLAAQGIAYDHTSYADPATDPCNAVDPSTGLPRKLFQDGAVSSYRGTRTAYGNSCSAPPDGPDTCCGYCDWLLTTKVERYGIDGAGTPRGPNPGTTFAAASGERLAYADAIACRTSAIEPGDLPTDKYQNCRGFIPAIDRSDEEQTWEYEWCAPGTGGPECPLETQQFRLPLTDLLRETHPDLRPAGFENLTAKCDSGSDCDSVHGLEGTECMGVGADGLACLMDAHAPEDGTCTAGLCRPQWFVSCSDDSETLGGDVGYCVDRRFSLEGSTACFVTAPESTDTGLYGAQAGLEVGCEADGTECDGFAGSGAELSRCDFDEDGKLSAEECCQGSLYGPPQAGSERGSFDCDPYYQSNVLTKPLYQRDTHLPRPTKSCVCPRSGDLASNEAELDDAGCLEVAEVGCFDDDGDLRSDRAGKYAVKFVSTPGGVIYDPAAKGIVWLPADRGGIPRAAIEECAYDRDRLIGNRNRHEGWRAHDNRFIETRENFDRAMCSGSEYKVVFTDPGDDDNPAHVRDKVGNTLEGKTVYAFETPQFHIQPGSGSPTDNLRIGACGKFFLRFSNKYDLTQANLSKLAIWRVECSEEELGDGTTERVCTPTTPHDKCDQVAPVAGGASCVETPEEVIGCAAPCLSLDVQDQYRGIVGVEVDPDVFNIVLQAASTYRLTVPAADTVEQALSDPNIYQSVFWDVCGMPLVRQGATPYDYEFTIDPPKCDEDADKDLAPLSCDNAEGIFNPGQDDGDRDGWGDVVDLCPLLDSDRDNSADSDRDGVGNACDACTRTLTAYNEHSDGIPTYMQVRNIPNQTDTDGDGIGDVCDNCVWQPNCGGYGDGERNGRYLHGELDELYKESGCQRDGNENMVGDACDPDEVDLDPRPGAFGPIGFGDDDDFDQDGIRNLRDACPRQPLPERIECSDSAACGDGRTCDDGLCNHWDTDAGGGDGVGDICDSCPFVGNGMQTEDGGMQDEDPDDDFVGANCETAPRCADSHDPRRLGFHWVHQQGYCCTVALIDAPDGSGDLLRAEACENPSDPSTCNPLLAPHPDDPAIDIPVRRGANCTPEMEEAFVCRALRPTVEARPGIVEPPPGCEVALEMSDRPGTNTAYDNLHEPVLESDFAGTESAIDGVWGQMCFLPQLDQDFDGLGDDCDLCPLAFDPDNAQFVDDNNRLWPNFGKYCEGDYAINNRCELMDDGGEPDPMGDESGESGEGEASSGGGEGTTSGG